VEHVLGATRAWKSPKEIAMSSSVLTAPRPHIAITGSAAGRPGFWSRVLSALQAYGERRASVEIRRVALTHFAADPELRRRLLAASDASDSARR
jgi:hypothetical protein